MNTLKGIVYVSDALITFDNKSLISLAEKASYINESLGVTGYLSYENGSFLQYIEGEQDVVEILMNKISKDKRHHMVMKLVRDGFQERWFPSWHMQLLTKNELVQIQMENVITQYIRYLKSMSESGQNDDSSAIWGMINHLSKFRNKMVVV